MEFNAIDQIKHFYGIQETDLEEVRKLLRVKLANIHPDKTGGQFGSKKQQNDYEELNSAIELISNSNTNNSLLITNKEWAVVQQNIDYLTKLVKQNNLISQNEFEKSLV